jgi:UDP-N-acetylglucosamine--dolichyl-phosphate N-acetylglucosaminephosphotransferase
MFPGIFPGLAFIITLILTPVILRDFRKRNIVGIDLHKEGRPEVPEMVGVSLLAAISISFATAYFFIGEAVFLFALAVTMATGLLGILDHYRPLTPAEKIIGLTLIGLSYPLYLSASDHQGLVLLLLLPILFMVACNFTNMLAGFNGLEIGVGAIASIGVAAVAYINNAEASLIIASTTAAALLAFLYYNKFPARVFPGDVGTLIIGAALFTAIFYGELYLPGVIIFIPYALDAGLKFLSAGVMTRHSQAPTKIENGKLYAPMGGNLSLPRLLLRIKPMGEREAVRWIWSIEAFAASIAVALEAAL